MKRSHRFSFLKNFRLSWFTLVELIVVITILAILATIGFLALSGYTQDAKDSAVAANVRSVYSMITSESALTGNSPRYYIVHDPGAALTGAIVYVDDNPVILTWGAWNQADTNYSAGNPDFAKLKLNPDKFKISALFPAAFASYDTSSMVAAAIDLPSVSTNGKARIVSFAQVWGVSSSGRASVTGNFHSASWSVAWLLKFPGTNSPMTDGTFEFTPKTEEQWTPSNLDEGNGDPYWNDVVFLLRANGTNGTISDMKSWIPIGNQWVTVDVSKKKYSSASMSLPGCVNGSGNLVMTGTFLAVWTGSYTIDFWYNYLSDNNGDVINANGANQIAFPRLRWMGSKLTYYGTSWSDYAQYSNAANTWMHVAMVRNGTEKRLYINGVSQPTTLTDNINYTATSILIGRTWNYGYCVKGNIEDMRFTKAVRYSTGFTVPTAPASTYAK